MYILENDKIFNEMTGRIMEFLFLSIPFFVFQILRKQNVSGSLQIMSIAEKAIKRIDVKLEFETTFLWNQNTEQKNT